MREPTDVEPPSSQWPSNETGKHRSDAAKSVGGWLQRLATHLLVSSGGNLRETLEKALKAEGDGGAIFTSQERTMLLNILRFGGLRVEDVMVPRADIIALDEEEPLSALLELFAVAGHSRVPVYRETLDDPQGMVHIKDVLRWLVAEGACEPGGSGPSEADALGCEQAVCKQVLDLRRIDLTRPIASAKLTRDLLFVPPSMPVVDLLLRMQSTRIHLALVVDEYGGTDGLLSIENLVEEVVGDIEDEHDVHTAPLIVEEREGRLVVDARTPIPDLEERLAMALQLRGREDEADTIGGLIFSMLGRVPPRGELVKHPAGIEFEVLDADPRRIRRLRVHKQQKRGPASAENEGAPDGEASEAAFAGNDGQSDAQTDSRTRAA